MRCFVVKGGHAQPLWAGHPWVYAEGVEERAPEEGEGTEDDAADVVLVRDENGRTIGRGLLSEHSAIRVRLLDRPPLAGSVSTLLEGRIRGACRLRQRLFPDPACTNAYRLVHAEGDGLPGLVVDRYADVLVAQFATAPLHRRREALAATLLAESGASALVARPAGYEEEEGIAVDDVPFHRGAPLPPQLEVKEEGMTFEVEPLLGQKTGHYADQRENRVHVASLARDADVLDLYAGTAGFSVQSMRHGAKSALAVESSPRAAAAAVRIAELNGIDTGLDVREADVRHVLKELKHADRTFDVVVLDPPNFFPRKGTSGYAIKAHRELNVQALTRAAPGGMLATFTCSARFDAATWRELVLSSARECRRSLRVVRELTAGPDHPVSGAAPDGRYLTGLLVIVDPWSGAGT